MKKVLSLFLAMLMAFSLAACSPKESISGVAQNEEVSIAFPAEYVRRSEITEEEFIGNFEVLEGFISATLNADGSVTLVITKTEQNRILQGAIILIDETIVDLVEDETTSFSEITYNSNLTEFNMVVNRANFESGWDIFYAEMIGDTALVYHTIYGDFEDVTINVYIIDEDTDEIIDTATFDFNV